jgi:arylsulfatase A-like enzyme
MPKSPKPKTDKPNILVIWGDDIGIANLSCYTHGLMGYQTPNIDRIAKEGMLFTDSYGEQSCTAGRSSFITGQSVYRTGLSKVGIPGAPIGMNEKIITIAAALKNQGYATGQFGKNHLGDLNSMLPTNHGFDEFYGNLYHLNAEEEPEADDYPDEKEFPNFHKTFGPRGVMHAFTHTKPKSLGQAGRWQSPYHDTMIDHDKNVGQALDFLDEAGIADNTFVMYSTDNGPHMNSWPDGAMTPFRSEKNTNWEGAFRVPMLVRWPGKIKPGQISNEIIQHHDWFPTFLAMAGDPDVAEKLKAGYQAIGRTYKNHLDAYNLAPYLTGQEKKSPRNFFMYLSDDGDVLGLRYDNWKVVFMEQRCPGTLQVWAEPFTKLRVPKLFNLRTDPFERADITSNSYYDWFLRRVFMIYGAQAAASQWAATFKDFPPIQKPNTFTLDDALKAMHETAAGMH